MYIYIYTYIIYIIYIIYIMYIMYTFRLDYIESQLTYLKPYPFCLDPPTTTVASLEDQEKRAELEIGQFAHIR